MSSKCGKCLQNVNIRNKSRISCNDCCISFHLNCVNLTPEHHKFCETNSQIWRCDECSKVRRSNMVLKSKTDMTFEDVITLLFIDGVFFRWVLGFKITFL